VKDGSTVVPSYLLVTGTAEFERSEALNRQNFNIGLLRPMPTISRFYGVKITMYYAPREHAPAHFHAAEGGEEAQILIDTGQVLRGRISPHALSKVQEWCDLHRAELQANWERAMTRREAIQSIAPLP